MKLEWLAAVLRPQDMAPRRTAFEADDAVPPQSQLAAALMGRELRNDLLSELLGRREKPESTTDSEIVDAALQSLDTASINEGAAALKRFAQDPQIDVAVAAAAALMGASAFARLENYEACEEILQSVLSRLNDSEDPATLLLRSSLLQQLCLRKRDWAQEHYRTLSSVYEALLTLGDGGAIARFPVGPYGVGDSRTTVRHILIALRYAVWSISPSAQDAEGGLQFPVRDEMLEFERSEQDLLNKEEAADQYARYIQDQFRYLYNDSSSFMGRAQPDLFYYNLNHELYGSGAAYGSRRELALFMLTQAATLGEATNYAECLRLLRYANADNELDLAIKSIRLAGPLSALSRDCRQVLSRRLTPTRVRYADLSVLRGAAELLTRSEAADALNAAYELLESGSPTNVVGRWTAYSKRLENTWRAVVELANATGNVSGASEKLLRQIRVAQYEETVDLAYARTLKLFDWTHVDDGLRTNWRGWLLQAGDQWSYTAEVVRLEVGEPPALSSSTSPRLVDIANLVNTSFRGQEIPPHILSACAHKLRDTLEQLERTSAGGPWGIGGIDAADVTAALALEGVAELWEPLTNFLTSTTVPRRYRSGAFNRLATADFALNQVDEDIFRMRAKETLWTPDPMVVDGERITPYPAALRFFGVNRLVGEEEVVFGLTRLAGSSDRGTRAEAARSASALSRTWHTPWMVSLVLQLSYDANVETRGYAAHALAKLLTSDDEAVRVGRQRLIDLLSFDGIIVPLLAIRGLNDSSTVPDSAVAESIATLARDHPSKRVRDEAAALRQKLTGSF